MADIPITNGIMVTMVYTYNSQRYVNVYHCTKGTPATFANLQTVAGVFRSWESLTGKTLRANTSSHVLVSTKALDGAGSPVYDEVVNPIVAGTGGANGMPSFVSIAVRHTSGLSGRSYRGRTYLGAVPSNNVINLDYVLAAFVVVVNNAFAALKTNLTTAGYTLVVASKYHGVDSLGRPIPRALGIMTPIVMSECGVGLDTQRHRKITGII